MADADDSTRAPFGRRELLMAGAALSLVNAGERPSEGMALLDALIPAMDIWDEEDPRYPEAMVQSRDLGCQLYALTPRCLGDAVAKMLGVLLIGEPLPPGDVGMIAAAVEVITANAPGLRRPALINNAFANARAAFQPGGWAPDDGRS